MKALDLTEEISQIFRARKPSGLTRNLLIIGLGPLIGGLIVYLIMMGMTAPWFDSDLFGSLWFGAVLYIGFGWLAGLAPAAVSALLWQQLHMDGRPLAWRIPAAQVIGAVTSVVLTWPVIALLLNNLVSGYLFNLLSALSGALALLFTTLLPAEPRP